MRMLLVEDDAAIVASLTDLLRSEGYETRCADGQDAAVELLRSERFDLCLLYTSPAQCQPADFQLPPRGILRLRADALRSG